MTLNGVKHTNAAEHLEDVLITNSTNSANGANGVIGLNDLYDYLSSEERSAIVDLYLEDATFAAEVEDVEKWWSSPRFAGIKRPYTAEQICSKRGSLKVQYVSDAMSKKLWDILMKRVKVIVNTSYQWTQD